MMRTRDRLIATSFAAVMLAGCGVSSRGQTSTFRPAAFVDGVGLMLAHRSYHAGQPAAATVVNRSHSLILASLCLRLQRLTGGRWITISRTHGINLPCPQTAGMPLRPGVHQPISLPLYDDLVPGDYRATLRYKPIHPHGNNLGNLEHGAWSISAALRVLPFAPGPRPTLSEPQILKLAEHAAAVDGDQHDPDPARVRHAL